MRTEIDPLLNKWVSVKLLDAETAERIRQFEAERQKKTGLRWPVLIALALGGLMLAAGVLLFVAAHWDQLSPAWRFALVLAMVAAFHIGGAIADSKSLRALAITLHGIGTVACGGGIFLAGQIFNLEEHWPAGVLMWAIAAVFAWWIRRDWVQTALTALLVPGWLVSEWIVRADHYSPGGRIAIVLLLGLAVTYFTVDHREKDYARTALRWIGGIALLPLAFAAPLVSYDAGYVREWRLSFPQPSSSLVAVAWMLAVLLPLALAFLFRRERAWINAAFIAWAVLLTFSKVGYKPSGLTMTEWIWNATASYVLGGLGSVALIAWGLREQRKERINIGLAGCAVTIIAFYFSEMMGKLDRSLALIGGGVIFFVVAWSFEKARRKLIARMAKPVEGGAQ